MLDQKKLATKILENIKSPIKVVHTTSSPSGTLAAYSGSQATVSVTPPEGYSILTHIEAWNTGIIGIVTALDTYVGNESTARCYQFNARNAAASSRGTVHVLTLCIRDDLV